LSISEIYFADLLSFAKLVLEIDGLGFEVFRNIFEDADLLYGKL